MEVLLNQFGANVTLLQPGEDLEEGSGDEWEEKMLENVEAQQKAEGVAPNIETAYTGMNITKDMRRSMKEG
ncbi:hypothetical protein GGI42DRAFT_313835 [Trichoderma sp. SZMC 28013]